MNTALQCGSVLVVGCALLTGSGCQRQDAESVPSVPVAAPGTGSIAAGSETPAAMEAKESGLSLRRGTVTLTADSRALRFCGETLDVWLVDQGDPTLDDVYAKLAGEPGTPLYVEIRGERVTSPAGTTIPATFKQAFLLEELLYAALATEGRGCSAGAPAYRLQARGNEPFWAIEIGADKMSLRQAGEAVPLDFPMEETLGAEGSATYRGTTGGHSLELTLTNGACSDSMSGDYFAYLAEARLDGRLLNGCARLGE